MIVKILMTYSVRTRRHVANRRSKMIGRTRPRRSVAGGSKRARERHRCQRDHGAATQSTKPKTPNDLTSLYKPTDADFGRTVCLGLRPQGKKINVRVDGPLIFNSVPPQIDAAVTGLGISLLPEDEVTSHIQDVSLSARSGRLVPRVRGLPLVLPQ